MIYLICFSSTENERALDPEEKPHQFTEHNSPKPLIFLRMKVSLVVIQLHRFQYIIIVLYTQLFMVIFESIFDQVYINVLYYHVNLIISFIYRALIDEKDT